MSAISSDPGAVPPKSPLQGSCPADANTAMARDGAEADVPTQRGANQAPLGPQPILIGTHTPGVGAGAGAGNVSNNIPPA